MKILNLGSLNFDKVYDMPHFICAGESLLTQGYGEFLGGKGLNQSIALARAGAQVYHVGAIGHDGEALRSCLRENGVDVTFLRQVPSVSGHAIVQNVNGENCIIVFGGANRCVTQEDITAALADFEPGDILLLQNETSNVPFAMEAAKARGLQIAFNASPITDEILHYPLELVDYFLINEVEGKALSGSDTQDFEEICADLAARFPHAAIVLTVGEKGVLYRRGEYKTAHPCYKVPVADTTAAGDTFCGYFLAGIAVGEPVEQVLRRACMASAIAVSRHGASPSIPLRAEVDDFAAHCTD